MPRRGVRVAAAVAALAAAVPAAAQPYDPRYRWETLDTPHFQLHFHQGEAALAQACARAAERAHAALSPVLGHTPSGRTQVVLSDDTDDANGSATPLPYNTVRLYAVPPWSLSELNDYDDWVESLVSHEYTHILHLDTVEGIPRVGNRVFGKLFAPNAALPSWMVEGMAVLHEGGPGDGRNHSALFDMYARAIVVGRGGLFRLDEVSNDPLDWPRGNLHYLVGGRFVEFLQAGYGDRAIAVFSHHTGALVWPYALDGAAEHAFGGKSLAELWSGFEEALRSRYGAQLAAIRRRTVTEPARVTWRGAAVYHPRWSPDGSFIAYYDQGLDERAGLRRVAPDGRDLGRAAVVDANGSFALASSRKALVAISDVYEEYEVYDDLYLVDLDSGRRTRVTRGERATDPDLSADGRSAVYVARSAPGEMALRRVQLAGGAPETLFERPGAQIYLPRISPDGRRIAFELHENGARQIAIWEDGRIARITDDDALATGPAWSPSGDTLFFASDRTGVFNVYAWEPATATPTATSTATSTPTSTATPTSTSTPTSTPTATPNPTATPRRRLSDLPLLPGRLQQVTNVETGAFQPTVSPDDRTLALVTYGPDGFDIATLPLDRAQWMELAPVAPRPPPPPRSPDDPEFPSRPYRALETLGPTFWLPSFAFDALGASLGVLSAGGDVVGLHAWILDARYSFEGHDVDYSAAYAAGWMYPRLSLGSSRAVVFAPGTSDQVDVVWTPLALQLELSRSHLDHRLALDLGWRGTSYRMLAPPTEVGATPFADGFASELSARLSYGDAFRFVRSISPEEGRVVALDLRYASPAIASSFSYASALASGTQYLRVPGTRHVALALHLAGGIAEGTLGGRKPFSLGGMPPPDPLALLLGAGPPSQVLRGYRDDAFDGTRLVSGNVELRFPIAAPQRGYGTWPVFLRRVHGALFLDAGEAFTPGEPAPDGVDGPWVSNLRFGAGAELRLEVVLGYYLRTDLRFGVARGLGRLLAPWSGGGSAADPLAVTQVYFTIGEAF